MRRKFSSGFKREAVALLESSGRPSTQGAGELGIEPSMLWAWRLHAQHHDRDASPRMQAALRARRFVAPAPSRIWLGDIPYVATADGWLNLAAVVDLATRKIVGGAICSPISKATTIANGSVPP